jgi:prophage DNA circulation protein
MADQKDYTTKEDLKNLREGVKADLRDFKEEIIHRFHIISEDHFAQIKQVAEGVLNVDEKLERNREETRVREENNFNLLSQAIATVSDTLQATRQELKHEIQESRQEILAAVKFSYVNWTDV